MLSAHAKSHLLEKSFKAWIYHWGDIMQQIANAMQTYEETIINHLGKTGLIWTASKNVSHTLQSMNNSAFCKYMFCFAQNFRNIAKKRLQITSNAWQTHSKHIANSYKIHNKVAQLLFKKNTNVSKTNTRSFFRINACTQKSDHAHINLIIITKKITKKHKKLLLQQKGNSKKPT